MINQTYKKLEILLINDGSTDLSPYICDEYAQRDSRVTVIHKENQGVSSARNIGIDMAHGDFVSFIDSDDWIELNTYEHLIGIVIKHEVDAVLFEYYIDYENKQYVHKTESKNYGLISANKAIEFTILPINRFACVKLFSKKIIKQIKFDFNIHIGEDTLFSCYALNNAKSVYFTSEPLYHYIQSSSSATRNNLFNDRKMSIQIAYIKLIDLCKKNYHELVEVAIAAYLTHTINLIYDLYNMKHEKKTELLAKFAQDIRRNAATILKSKKVGTREKIKVATCYISPKILFYLLRFLRSD